MFDELYYRHSGRFSVTGLLVGLLAGTLAGGILAGPYAYGTLYIPIVYASFILVAVFGAAIGFITTTSMARFKVRNSLLMMLVNAAVALVGLYVCWAIWLYALLQKSGVQVPLVPILVQPDLVWGLILEVNKEGAWSLTSNSEAVSGIPLWFVWVTEAAMIVGIPLAIAQKTLSAPFCELCESWCKVAPNVYRSPIGDTDTLRLELESKNFAHLETLGNAPPGATEWLQFDLHRCPDCSQTATVTVSHAVEKINRKGEKSVSKRSVVHRLLLDSAETERLLQVCQRLAAPPPPDDGALT